MRFEGLMSVSPESIGDLNWWVESRSSAYRSIDHGVPFFTLTSDASQRGWGAASGTFSTHGLWSEAETTYHINALELLTVELGLRSLLVGCQDQHIRVVSDMTTAVSYLNGMGVNLCLVTASLATFGPGLLIGEIGSLRRLTSL